MKRILGALVAMLAVLALTTGCYKVNADLKVNADDTVSGSFVIAYPKIDTIDSIGGTKAEFVRPYLGDAAFKTKLTEIKDADFYGVKATFENVPYADFNTDTTGENKYGFFKFERVGDNIVFDATLNPTEREISIAELAESLKITEAEAADFAAKTDVRVTLDIPGTISETNGEPGDGGLTWVGEFGKPLVMHAETWAPLVKSTDLLPIAGGIVIFVFVLAFLFSRPKHKRDRHISYE